MCYLNLSLEGTLRNVKIIRSSSEINRFALFLKILLWVTLADFQSHVNGTLSLDGINVAGSYFYSLKAIILSAVESQVRNCFTDPFIVSVYAFIKGSVYFNSIWTFQLLFFVPL